jgi:HSP20 family protein
MFKDYDELVREMQREMQRLADQAFAGLVKLSEGPDRFWYPRADIHETAEHILVIVEIAGLDRDRYQIELSADNSSLVVRGSRAEMPEDRIGRVRCHQLEIYFGGFERVIPLPIGHAVDRNAVEASYRDGFLRIILPRVNAPSGRIVATDDRQPGDRLSEGRSEDPSARSLEIGAGAVRENGKGNRPAKPRSRRAARPKDEPENA